MFRPFPSYYVPRANNEEFVVGIRRQVKFELGAMPDVLRLLESNPDCLAAVWCLLRETLVVCEKLNRDEKEIISFAVAHLHDCQVLLDGHLPLLRACVSNADKVERTIAEGRYDVPDEVLAPAAKLSPRIDAMLGWTHAVFRLHQARARSLPLPLDALPELAGVILLQSFLCRLANFYIPKRGSLLKMFQSSRHIQPTDVYMKRQEVPMGESTQPIFRYTFDSAFTTLLPEFSFAQSLPHIALAINLWSVVMRRICEEYLSERSIAVLDLLISRFNGTPELTASISADSQRLIDEQLSAPRERQSVWFVWQITCARQQPVDRREVTRFEKMWQKSEQRERVLGAVLYGLYLGVREQARLISNAIQPEPRILFKEPTNNSSNNSSVQSNVQLQSSGTGLSPKRSPRSPRQSPSDLNVNADPAAATATAAAAVSSGSRSTLKDLPMLHRVPSDTVLKQYTDSTPTSALPLSGIASRTTRPHRHHHRHPAPASHSEMPSVQQQSPQESSGAVSEEPSNSRSHQVRRSRRKLSRTQSLDRIEGLDRIDPAGNTRPVSMWKSAEVQQWLQSIGCQRHLKRFIDADVTGIELLLLTNERLESMGIRRPDERDSILKSLSLMPAAESSLSRQLSSRSLHLSSLADLKANGVRNELSQPFSNSAPNQSPNNTNTSAKANSSPDKVSRAPAAPRPRGRRDSGQEQK